MIANPNFTCKNIEVIFNAYPEAIQTKMLCLRSLIFEVASNIPEIESIEETIKWGEPSYRALPVRLGSTIRMNWKEKTPDVYYLFFHCKTCLIETFRNIYGDIFTYGRKRSLIFKINQPLPIEALSDCIEMALTYHQWKRCI